MAIGELLMIQTKQGKQGRMKIMNVNRILLGLVTVFISRTISKASLYPTSGHPNGKPMRVMISPVHLWTLNGWRPPELPSPNHEGVVQHAAGLQVTQ